jgi:hypothetical protein
MGEDTKPKVVVKSRGRWNAGQRPIAAKKEKFKAPTPGLEHHVFRVGDAKDAAAFTDISKALARYAGSNFKVGAAMAVKAIEDLSAPDLSPPEEAPDPTDVLKYKMWELGVDSWGKKMSAWDDAGPRAFQPVLSHCEPAVVDKLEASSKWTKTKEDQNVIALLQLIQGITHQHDEVKQGTMAYVDQLVKWILNFQKDGQDLSEWLKTFKAGAEIIDTFGGKAGFHPKVVEQHTIKLANKLNKTADQLTDDEAKEAIDSACEEFKACALIRLSNNKVFGDLKKDLDNMHLFGHSAYATTVDGAYRQLQNYQVMHGGQKPSGRPMDRDKNADGLAFFQGTSKACHSCGKPHLLKDCPDLTDEEKRAIYQAVKAGTYKKDGQAHANVATDANAQECLEGVANINVNLDDVSISSAPGAEDGDIFVDGVGFLLPTDHWTNGKKVECGRNKIFLDSCATNHTMFAVEHLTGCHETKTFLRQNCNAGSKLVNRMGTWRGLKFWINEDGIANLLSIPQLEKSGCKIQYNTGGKWMVLTPNN